MRLAAIYIKEHFLFDEPVIINLGGKYIYSLVPNKNVSVEIKIVKDDNPDFIEGFWGENINLVSAVVGENGAGKTILLNEILNIPRSYIFENNKNESYYYNYHSKNPNVVGLELSNDFFFNFEQLKGEELISRFNINDEFEFISDKELVKEIESVYKKIKFYDKVKNQIKIDKDFPDENEKTYKDSLIEINKDEESIYFKLSKINFDALSNETKVLYIFYINLLMVDKNKDDQSVIDLNKLDESLMILITAKLLFFISNKNNFKKKVSIIDAIVKSYEEFTGKLENKIISFPLNKLNNELEINDENIIFLNNYFKFISDLKFLSRNNFLKDCDFITTPNHNLSFGEKQFIRFFSKLKQIVQNKDKDTLKILLLDEVELGFHPLWKKRFVQVITKVIPIIIKNCNIQIIFTTHDPLTLSDIPNNNIVYLKKDGDKTKVLKGSERTQKSFGANITDLLADSFFFGNEDKALIGDFAKGKIQGVIDCLNKEKSKKEEFEKMYPNGIYEIAETSEKLIKDNKKIIDLIDEPIMRNKLLEMYNEIFDGEIEIEREKKLLIKRAKELGLKIDYPKN